MKKSIYLCIMAIGFIVAIFNTFHHDTQADSNEKVYIIPLEETVEKGLSQYIKRTVADANSKDVKHIILEIDTLGGAVDGALEIADTLRSSEIPITAYINRRAISAGAYIALNANQIYMAPGSQMGSAAIITGDGNAADDKSQSLWLSELKESAEYNDRDPKYALAMADKDVDIPEYAAGKGKLLTLNSTQAIEVGYSEGTANNIEDLLTKIDLSNASIIKAEESLAEKFARFITNPVVVPILLSIGSIGLVVELYSPGFGVPGFMGLSSLLLFFYGHYVAGLAGMESIILFILGIILIIAEFFVPGGIIGIIGFASVIGSLYIASGNFITMTISLLISFAVAILASILIVKVFGKRMKLFNKLILRESTNTESGYVSNQSRTDLIGKEGTAITTLRPSGTAVISDERLDVVTEGSYIMKGQKIKVIKVEGPRIVVREV